MKNLQDVGLLLLRVCVSLFMMTHGWGKIEKLMAGGEMEFFDFLGMGPTITLVLTIMGEFIAPLFILIGFKTRWAATVAAFTMGVAAFHVHSGDPFGDREASM
ncbi:MAG: DoxX family protein, partial [Bacteroidota bacterium]